jgi:hypothetical protein
MSSDTVHQTELAKIVDDGTYNNYGEWEIKSYHKLREWNLLKYIEGATSQPPIIPPLRQTVTRHGVGDNGHLTTIHVPGNLAEHEQAVNDAEPWMTGNNTTLARIIAAVPGHQLHLVKRTKYAKQAWESLRSVYQLRNSLRASTIKGQIMAYRCQPDMNIVKWLTDMQRLYISLCDLNTDRMSDRDFALAILDRMPQDKEWRVFLSELRTKVCDSDSQELPIDSTTFINAIRDEYWYRHKDDYETTSQRRSSTQKRPRDADTSPGSAPSPVSAKRARRSGPKRR